MTPPDLLELDDAAFEARIRAVKQRLPQPREPMDYLPSWYERHAQDYVDTVPSDHTPLHAAHAASEIEDRDAPVQMLGGTLIAAALAAAVLGVVGVLAWVR